MRARSNHRGWEAVPCRAGRGPAIRAGRGGERRCCRRCPLRSRRRSRTEGGSLTGVRSRARASHIATPTRMARIPSSQRPSPAAEADPGRAALIEALRRPRYEILPLDGIADDVVAHVPREIRLTVTASARRGLDASLALVERLRATGYAVVPHISARLVRDPAHLEEVVGRLRAAGV